MSTTPLNSVKIPIALEEMELPYKVEIIDIFIGEGQKPKYLVISPGGKIPAVCDEDDGTTV
ncbi:MAG: glutathione S-transferase N-terminal domain-containing protein [Candidatus Devosia symbiotica]|nr:glutathione S-transferase N-terminal domain-containing protein [Candidatus Devosia symbiotica]